MSDDLARAVDARIESYRPDAVPPFAALEARKRGRDRRRMAAVAGILSLIGMAGAVAALPPLTGGGDRLTPGNVASDAPGPAPTASDAPPATASCAAERDLVLGHVPEGWDAAFQTGAGGGGSDPAAVGHWVARTPGRYVQVTRGRTVILTAPFRALTVLGEPARAGQIHEGLGADFRLCEADYQLQGYGISEPEFHRLAESLSTAYPYTDCDALRPGDPLDFTNFVCAPGNSADLRTIDCIDGIYVHLVRPGLDDLEGIVGRTAWRQAAPADPTHGRTPWAFDNCKEHG